jgi:hypothetical protein
MSSSPSAVALVVTPSASAPATSANKRKITPSAEQSSSKRQMIITTPSYSHHNTAEGTDISTDPFYAPKQLFPRGTARVPHAQPLPNTNASHVALHTRNILLPVDLRDPKVNPLGKDVVPMLRGIFPGTTEIVVGMGNGYVHFKVKEMPKTPWPLTVGGIPITIGTDAVGRGPLFPRAALGRPSLSICNDFNGSEGFSNIEFRRLGAAVVTEFRKNSPDIRLVEIIFTMDRAFYIIVGNESNIGPAIRNKLPGRIAGCFTGYLHDREIHRPKWVDRKAKREIEPHPVMGVVDTTAYEVVRPGVMICSKALKDHGHPATYSTTSGVLVKNVVGNRFMTAAAHGIGENETVYQPLTDGEKKVLGRTVQEISFTDVSLVALEDGVEFINENFENSSGVVPRLTRLFGENPDGALLSFTPVYLNSPYTGNMEGSLVASSLKVECHPPIHPVEEAPSYVAYDWVYTGQVEGSGDTSAQPPNGTCGSAIWDDDGVVIGFYHYHIADGRFAGFAISVSASEVVKAGYCLVG